MGDDAIPTSLMLPAKAAADDGERIRVQGTVQGVGFRPAVWHLAHELALRGWVRNDAAGLVIALWGPAAVRETFVRRLPQAMPPLAHITRLERTPLAGTAPEGFHIVPSTGGPARTGVVPDAAICDDCRAEIRNPADRRYRYPFTNCTRCGPRLSIIRAVPYDRANTSMASFTLCDRCQAEFDDPSDRRFHAQPNACPACGPRLWLEDAGGRPVATDDAIREAAAWLASGRILAIKGIGGFHLACDATDAAAVRRLRARKRRDAKPFALMARDVAMVREYARVSDAEAALLQAAAAPIVVLSAAGRRLPEAVAPGQATLGFMLPYAPLHVLLLDALDAPIVLTSGNRSDEPQCIDNDEARQRLGDIADAFVLHDRAILNRLDDSVARVSDGQPRLLRRARGYAPAPLAMPPGFESGPPLLAMGGELKNTFCLYRDGQAVLSAHIGDLEEPLCRADYRRQLALYQQLHDHRPAIIVVDRHPDYFATLLGREWAAAGDRPLIAVQHHHAHIAAVMAEHRLPIDTSPVLGIALDGLGYGDDGELWGGEFLLADYAGYRRVARFQPVPLPGGVKAMREPWRNTWAQLAVNPGWATVAARHADLALIRWLRAKPVATLEAMRVRGVNSPLASSCGRLFDAVAAAVGLCREQVAYEGQAAVELEALARRRFDNETAGDYRAERQAGEPETLCWSPLWRALLADLDAGTEPAVIAARFHHGLIASISETAQAWCQCHGTETVVLGGGAFQNTLLLEGIGTALRGAGLRVLAPSRYPANDGGLALGQVAVALARIQCGSDSSPESDEKSWA